MTSAALPPRLNPFRRSQTEALAYRFTPSRDGDPNPGHVADVEGLLRRFEALGRRAALVGAKGSGKTTLLLEIEGHLGQLGDGLKILPIRLRRDRRNLSSREQTALGGDLSRTLVTVDGAEQLSPPRWWRLRRRTRSAWGVLITVHRPGRLPTLRFHRTDPALLRELVRRLSDGAPMPPDDELESLFQKHRGNLRECLAELYDRRAAGRS